MVVENVVEIDPLGEDKERLSMKDSPAQEDKQESIGDVLEDKEEGSQPLPKAWRYATNHPKELILGDASKGLTTAPNSMTYVVTLLSFLILNPKASSKPRRTHIGC